MNNSFSLSNKYLYFIIGLTLFLQYLNFIFAKLVVGARWSSGLLLGGVDNWMNGGSLYTVQNEGMTPGSSYNPGSILLAMALRYIFGYNAETVIILCGAIFMFLMLWGMSLLVIDDMRKMFFFVSISCLLFFFEFNSARHYLLELHPDIPALVCFLWGVLCIDSFLKSGKQIYVIGAIILMCLSGLFKQNAAFLYLGLGIFVILSKDLRVKSKTQLLLIEAFAGFGVLIIMLSISGCWYNCVVVNSLHHMMTMGEYLSYLISVVFVDKFFVFSLLGFFSLIVMRKNLHLNLREKMWFSSAAFWFLFCMYGSAKEGANEGNIEAAIIAFLPFSVKIIWIVICTISEGVKKCVDKNYLGIINAAGCAALLLICVAIICDSSYNIVRCYRDFNIRLYEQNKFSEWLSSNYSGSNIAYNTYNYELLNRSEINKKTDLYTVAVYRMGDIIKDEDLSAIAEKERWDLIITIPSIDFSLWPKTFSRFERMNKSNYPSLFSNGEMVDIYIRK